jgi:acyl dehydratase
MLTIGSPREVSQHIGKEIGPSEWLTVTQEMIDKFAEATGDHQWIHVDVERARREMPGGRTIAHGFLTLSLIPRLRPQLMKVENQKRGINYGCNKVRFIAPVPAGGRVRLRQKLTRVDELPDGGLRVSSEMTMELEGSDKPAMVAETLGVMYG